MLKESYKKIANKISLKEESSKEYTSPVFKRYGIAALQNGLTIEKLKKDFPWIFNAEIKDAVIYVSKGKIQWHSGEWINGVWEDGEWLNGTWKKGKWINGTWFNGVWFNGGFNKGKFKDGEWKNGIWLNGIFEGGTWLNGEWHGGKWKNGEWKKGEIDGKLSNNPPK